MFETPASKILSIYHVYGNGKENISYLSISLSCIMYHHHHPQCRKNLHYVTMGNCNTSQVSQGFTREQVKWSKHGHKLPHQTANLNGIHLFGRTVSCFYSVKDQREDHWIMWLFLANSRRSLWAYLLPGLVIILTILENGLALHPWCFHIW